MSNKPFELDAWQKQAFILDAMNKLTKHHWEHCHVYQRFLDAWSYPIGLAESLDQLPYIPARAFKELELASVPLASISKTVTSSGTSGLRSKIFIDGRTSIKQSRALTEILKSYIGKKQPLLIIDSPGVGKNNASFSARSAGALGFSAFASDTSYALKDDLTLDEQAIELFLNSHGDSEFIVFGFTFLIWQSLVQNNQFQDLTKALVNGRLFHGGGWKKLEALNINDDQFKHEVERCSGISKIHNYYGMAEQTGSVFVECEHGKMHASKYSEVLIRNQYSLQPCEPGEKGIIQVFSSLPESYPGHVVLTEDFGWIEPDTLCGCGRNGTSIHIEGRLKRAEVRGCSDVY